MQKIYVYSVYILSNYNNNVLYIGVTNDLVRRCHEHKNKLIKGFSEKYNVNKLVYYELFDFIDLAIKREKQIKAYSREKKDRLIDKLNQNRDELYDNGVIKKITQNASANENQMKDSLL